MLLIAYYQFSAGYINNGGSLNMASFEAYLRAVSQVMDPLSRRIVLGHLIIARSSYSSTSTITASCLMT